MSKSVIRQLVCLGSSIVSKLDEVIDALGDNTSIDYTALLNQIISELQTVDANTDDIEQSLTDINSDTTATTTNTANTVVELQNILTELQDIDANTDGVEQTLTDILAALQTPDLEPTQAIVLPDTCASVDGADSVYLTPVVLFNQITGVFTGKTYFNSNGDEIVGVVTESDPCDCECEDCSDTSLAPTTLSSPAAIEFADEFSVQFNGVPEDEDQFRIAFDQFGETTTENFQITITAGNILDSDGNAVALPISLPAYFDTSQGDQGSGFWILSSTLVPLTIGTQNGIPSTGSTFTEFEISAYP